jgi:Bacterial Ig domain
MKNSLKFLPLLLIALAVPAARAQQLPVLTVALTQIDVNGVPAYGSNTHEAPGDIVTNSGQQLNGGNAPYGSSLTLWALAQGTSPVSGFTYNFFVNGINIGVAAQSNNYQLNYAVNWIPPQPGVYFLSVTASDGSHTAVSLAIEFYATGIELVSPVANTNLPIGSSVVLQAATSLAIGAVSRVDFFDESGLLGSSRTFPYSLIYTPAAFNPITNLNVHFIHAVSYDGNGVAAFTSSPAQGIIMVTAVGPVPVVSIGYPTSQVPPKTIAIPDYSLNATNAITVVVNASSPQGTISQVQLYINGVLFGTQANYPYTFAWQPSVTGTYDLTALAYDDKNNVIATTTGLGTNPLTPSPTVIIIGALPSVAIISPGQNGTLSGGGSGGGTATVTATATDTNVDSSGNAIKILSVSFILDGNVVAVASSPTTPGGSTYSGTFVPKQNIDPTTGDVIPSILTVRAVDSLQFTKTSDPETVSVDVGGSSVSAVIGTPPTVSITAPVNAANVVVNSPTIITAAAAATNNPGNVKQVQFLVDNVAVATVSAYPYSTTWTPTSLGTYSISAEVTDNDGNTTNSLPISITVVTEPPPSVNITSPLVGSISTVSQGLTINANATSPSGTISSVQFFENGIPIATTTTPPYTATFTPLSAGVFTITAVATDNSGETTTSAPVVIESLPATGGLGSTSYFGQYQGIKDGGRFAFIVVDGTYGYYISHSTGTTTPTTNYYPGIQISSGGTFSANALNGTVSLGGVNGTLLPSQDLFIGAATQAGTSGVASGFYSGNLVGQAGSQVSAIVGADGSLMLYVASGSYTDVADGTVDSNGNFTITTTGNNTVTGKVDPTTALLSGTLSGPSGGSILAAKVSGGTFSDGVLKNLATRGQVGTGADILIAGFVVGGSSPKQLLVRAIGPTLATFNVPGVVSATELQLFQGGTMLYSNTGWSSTPVNATAVSNADLQVGAFALPTGSADSALVGTFAPGSYTAMVSGVGGATGVGLVEIYDLDGYTPFSGKKLINVSTRGVVGAGSDNLIAGFSINGSAPKRLLIRAAGPALTGLNVSGALATPHLQLYNNSGSVIRENFSWQVGNDNALVTAAEQQTGAFAFANKSADSAILIVLPPGTYTAVVTGGSGVALVEVYEVP